VKKRENFSKMENWLDNKIFTRILLKRVANILKNKNILCPFREELPFFFSPTTIQ